MSMPVLPNERRRWGDIPESAPDNPDVMVQRGGGGGGGGGGASRCDAAASGRERDDGALYGSVQPWVAPGVARQGGVPKAA